MTNLRSLTGKFIGSVLRLPIGAVALADHEGNTFAMVRDDGFLCDRTGQPFDASMVQGGIAKNFAGRRFTIHETNTCELSPIGLCIGDNDTDESECVFCHAPEEQR